MRSLAPAISAGFASIVAKLLAKDPDDRYQTAYGLLKDLERLAPNSQSNQGFALDQAEIPFSGVSEIELEGREDELKTFAGHLATCSAKNPAAILIKGEAGTGKTRLLQEFIREIPADEVVALVGKCSQKNPVPFAPLRAAVEDWITHIQRLPDIEKAKFEQIIRDAAGEWASVLRHLSPGMQALLDSRSGKDRDFHTESSQEQFHTAVADFLLRVSRHRCGNTLRG